MILVLSGTIMSLWSWSASFACSILVSSFVLDRLLCMLCLPGPKQPAIKKCIGENCRRLSIGLEISFRPDGSHLVVPVRQVMPAGRGLQGRRNARSLTGFRNRRNLAITRDAMARTAALPKLRDWRKTVRCRPSRSFLSGPRFLSELCRA